MRHLLALALLACTAPAQQSVLLIVTDDVGSELLSWHPMAGPEAVSTPTLSALAASGVSYSNIWSMPQCSPTRSAILTGRWGHHTGVETIVDKWATWGLQPSEVTLPERLQARGYPCALFGKWHLANDDEAACSQGFDTWAGTLRNLGPGDYYDWTKWTDTATSLSTQDRTFTYATDTTTDDALAWIGAQWQPWFAMVSYNAAHMPWQNPPGYSERTDWDRYRAMIEYLDGEIGRLLAGVDMRSTTVLVVGDNGMPWQFGGGKSTVYRSGVETFLLAGGWAVNRAITLGKNTPGEVLDGHANVVDLYKTILRLMPGDDGGAVWPEVDGEALFSAPKGFHAERAWNFARQAEPLGATVGGPYTYETHAVEEGGYKAIWWLDRPTELYHVASDPWEMVDLALDGIDPWEQSVLDGLQARVVEVGL